MTKTAEKSHKGLDLLVQQAKTDTDAFGQLYDAFYDRILNYCQYRLFNADVAEDVTSKVFLAVASQIRAFKGRTEGEFTAWIYRIASNKANDYLRKSTRRNRLLLEAANTLVKESDAEPENDMQWPGLYRSMAKLKPKEQNIITLRFFENLSYEQISSITGLNASTVGVRIHRILKKLKNHLQRLVDGSV